MKKTDALSISPPNLNVVVAEALYDLQGRNAFNTVLVAKRQGATHPHTVGFETTFVNNRNPTTAQGGGFWSGGQMSGLVTSWVDSSIFSSQDKLYPYTGSYYETDPTSRLDKSSSLGAQFNRSSNYTPEYRYGQYQKLPRSSNQVLDITATLNKIFPNLDTNKLETLYTINASQVPLNNTTSLTTIIAQEFSGQAGVKLAVDSRNNYLLSNTTYQIGATTGQSGMPIVQQKQYHLPNTYDNSGNISSSDAQNFQILTEVNPLGQITFASSPDQGEARAYYDQGGLLRFTQDASQAQHEVCLYYTYDGLGRITAIYGLPLILWDVVTLQSYLNGSLPTSKILIRRYTYDILPHARTLTNTQGCLVKVESWNITTNLEENPSSHVTEVYRYNSLGRILSLHTTYNTQGPATATYTYTNTGQLQTITYPKAFDSSSIIGVLYTYNIQGQVANVGQLKSTYEDSIVNYYASYSYNPNGTIATEALNQGQVTRSYTYNILGQLTGISDNQNYFTETLSYTDGGNNAGNYQDGNIQQASYTFNYGSSNATNYSYQYTYDSFGRLVHCQSSNHSMPNWRLYAEDGKGNYDANGNIWGAQRVLNTYNAMTNQLLLRGNNGSTCAYDDSGRVVTISQNGTSTYEFTYDIFKPRPITVNQTTIVYNQAGERVSKSTASMTIQYYRLGAQVLQESISYSGTGNGYQLSYVYGPTGLIATEIYQTVGNNDYNDTYFMLKDDLGSIRSIYSSTSSEIAAYVNYTPWGRIAPHNSSRGVGVGSDAQLASLFRYLYTGQEWDANLSLYNYHARQYDPTLGRFLSPDPSHQTPSPYIYCANNPVNYTDPTGKMIYFYLGKEESGNPDLAELNDVSKNITLRMKENVQYMNEELIMGAYGNKENLFSAIRNLDTDESVYIGFHFNPDGNLSLPQKINVNSLANVLNEKISKTPGYNGSVYLLACEAGSEESHYFTQLRSKLNFNNPVYASPYKLNADKYGLFGKAEGFEEQFERVMVVQDRLSQASMRLTQEQTKLGNSIITRSQSTNISININNLRAEIGQLQAEVKEASKLLSSLMIRDANLLWKKI